MTICSNHLSRIQDKPPSQVIIGSGKTYSQFLERVASAVITIISPKQALRQGSSCKMFKEVAVKLWKNLAFTMWSVSRVFRNNLLSKEGDEYLHILSVLKTKLSAETLVITSREKEILESVFQQVQKDKNSLNRFDFFVASASDSSIKGQHKLLKEIVLASSANFFFPFKDKLQKLIKIKNLEEIEPLQEGEKLTLEEMGILTVISAAKSLLDKLKSQGIEGIDGLHSRVSELEVLSRCSFFEDLKCLCKKNFLPGTIILFNRNISQVFTEHAFGYVDVMQQLFMGASHHIGIIVCPEGKGLSVSHMNRMSNGHGITPVTKPLALPFYSAFILDAKPLVPSRLSNDQKEKITEIFSREFNKLAEEEHPEASKSGYLQQFNMLLFGHKKLFPQKLANVAFPSKKTPIMCSSYIGIIFLRAVQKMNEYMEQQGISGCIPHPFGEHENVMNLDILRLLYHWQRLNVMKPVPLNDSLVKVVSLNGLT